jgi:P27 family predicted phage terminase small subunit
MSGNTNSGRLGKNKKPPAKKTESMPIACPEKLQGDARKYWDRVYPLISGTLEPHYFFAFERICWLYGQWCDAEKAINQKGMSYETKTDRGSFTIRERPEVKMILSLNKEIKDLERKLGLTPLDAKQVKTSKKNPSVRDKY